MNKKNTGKSMNAKTAKKKTEPRKTRQELEDMRQVICDSIVDLSDAQILAMHRTMVDHAKDIRDLAVEEERS